MTMQTYELMTLGAEEILRFGQHSQDEYDNWTLKYHYDFRESAQGQSQLIKNSILKSIARYDESALTYQIKAQLLGKGPEEDISDVELDLKQTLIYVDFQNLFFTEEESSTSTDSRDNNQKSSPARSDLLNMSADSKMQILFRNGFTLLFDNGIEKTFVPFDKSASMARVSRITFIDRNLKDTMDLRLMLDIPHNRIETKLSKLYAYRGLYLTAARRMILDPDTFTMTPNTVIVIKDDHPIIRDQKVLTATSNDSAPDIWHLTEILKDKLDINAFDGEGLISTDYARKINTQLKASGFMKNATSFQIRMPFTKGILHEVDFHAFAREVVGDDDIVITDVFNRPRSLKTAQIILTESMFKCCKWLATFVGKKDPMEYYFEKFKKYGHSLYVGNTDVNLSRTGRVKLNYQFLNTLDISGAEFEALIMQQKYAISLAKNKLPKVREFTGLQADEVEDNETLIANDPVWIQAYASNPQAFLSDPKIAGMVNGIEDSMIKDLGLGRIDVKGELRFVSRDLLPLLIHLLKCHDKWNASVAQKIEDLKKKSLSLNRFYLPSPIIKLDGTMNYGLLRNPHLSRNEQAVLMPYIPPKKEDNLYHKYFSHLKGVVMVPYKSLVPMALSGCDFDGDIVKVVAEKTIVQAILDGVYSKEDCSKRDLPIIEIPAVGSKDRVVPDAVDYETVKNTFSSQVGYISNLAIKFGKHEYVQAESDKRYAGKCAECTIVTGLEIDAAKTGRHPDLTQLKTLDSHKKDYFLQTKEKISALTIKRGLSFSTVTKGKDTEILVFYKKTNQPYLRVRETSADFNGANIDRLPYWFVKLLRDKIEKNKKVSEVKTPRSRPTYYTFQLSDDWRDNLDQDKLEALSNIIVSYNRLLRLASRVNKVLERYKNTKYAACIYNILTIKYDSEESHIIPGVTVKQALENTYVLLDQTLDSDYSAEKAIKQIVEKQWQFTDLNKRVSFLIKYLGITTESLKSNPGVEKLLTDFTCSGYKLLYYIVKVILCQKRETFAESLVDDAGVEYNSEKSDTLYTEMLDIYNATIKQKGTKNIWEPKLISLCRREIDALFSKDYDEAIMYAHSLRSAIDKSGSFFWAVFTSDEILRNIYCPKEIGGEANVK